MNEFNENESLANIPEKDDFIDLVKTYEVIRDSSKKILVTATIFGFFGYFFSINQPAIYRAEAFVSPVESSELSSMANLSGQFSGLANLIGFSNESGSSTQLNVAIMQSNSFLEKFILEKNLLPKIYPDQWNENEKKWQTDIQPDLRTAAEKLQSSLSIELNIPMRIIAVEWTKPDVAAEIANDIVKFLNKHIRDQKIEEANKSILFLQQELKKTSLVSNENMLYTLIEEQTKNVVLANSREEYAFKFIDPAYPPKDKIKPLNIQNAVLSAIAGLILSLLFLSRDPTPSVKDIAKILFFLFLSFFIKPPHPKLSSSV